MGTLCYGIIARLVGLRFGRLCGHRRHPHAHHRRVISAAMAGAAGSLYAHYLRIIDPDVFQFATTVTMVVGGGKGTLLGPIVGGAIVGMLPVALRPVMAPEAQWMVYGLVLIAILFVVPKDIVPGLARLFDRGRQTAKAPIPAEARPRSPERFEVDQGRELHLIALIQIEEPRLTHPTLPNADSIRESRHRPAWKGYFEVSGRERSNCLTRSGSPPAPGRRRVRSPTASSASSA